MRFLVILAAIFPLLMASGCSDKKQDTTTSETKKTEAELTYDIYPTTNMWNFIKLNTCNGKMWMVQFSVNDDGNRLEYPLNNTALVPAEKEAFGRFKLQPTQNIHTFILLDQTDGRTWQVQWGFEKEQMMVIPID